MRSTDERDTLSIRACREGDAAVVADLWSEAYVREGGGRTEPYVEADFHDTARRAEVLVAESDGKVVGVVALLPPGAPGRAVAYAGEAELARLAVVSAARRRGIGRALAEHCRARAKAAGWPAIALWSRRYQTEAHRLYESLGYRRSPARDTVDETGHERLVFTLALA